jgi:predicted nucleic acid-binding protein
MPVVVVVDTNVLRYALEEEKKIRENEENRKAYEVLVRLLSSGRAVIVFNPKTIEEYSRHINAVRAKLGKRMSPAFSSCELS